MLQSVLHYDIEKKLEEGGMGSVFLAEDTKLKRKVALKFLPHYLSSDDSGYDRFKNEAQAAASLNHPNIAQVYAIEETEDDLFIVMEYIEGKELKQLLSAGNLTQDEKIRIALQVAGALQAAHEKGILHRDVKSGNIMVDEKRNAKIMDFGLARIQGSEHLTKTGATLGTPAYMSPEQVRGREIDEQSDIWSYGVVLYELFTGELPFEGVYEPAVLYSITEEEPKTVTEVNPDLPDYIRNIIQRCLQKEKADRYRTIEDIIHDFENEQSEPVRQGEGLVKRLPSRMTYFWIAIPVLLLLLIFVYPFSKSEWLGLSELNALPSEQILAILPINNIGGDSTYQVISEGLAETLSGKVSQADRRRNLFSLIPASEVRGRDIKTAGKANEVLGVNLAVMSSIQPLPGDSIRLIMQLVDAENIRELESKIIDVPHRDLSSLQNKTVRGLLEMLNIEVNPEIEMAIREGDPSVPAASEYYVRGKAYLQRPSTRKNIDTAIRLFELAVEEDSTYALAYAGLGESYWRRYEELQEVDDVELAKKYIGKALELNSELAPVKNTMGMIQTGLGNHNEAIRSFKDALEIDPGNVDVYRNLARTYQSIGMPSLAEETFKQAIRLNPDLWHGYNSLGRFYLRQGRYEEAIQQYRKVTELIPDNWLGYANLGIGYYFLGQLEKAAEMYEESLARDTTYAAASNLGSIKFSANEYGEAARWYKVALKLSPGDYRLWGNLASACKWVPKLKNESDAYYKMAIEYGEEHLKVNPNDPSLISRLGSYYAELGDTANALEYTEEALELRPEDSNITYRAAVTYEVLGDRDEALHWIGIALDSGYSESEILSQPDLKELIVDERFQELIGKS